MINNVKTKLLDIVKRYTKFDKGAEIIVNGIDNAYPERIERTINNSVTAKTASNIMATYISGRGFGDKQDLFIVNKKGLTLKKFLFQISKDIAKQRGVFIHVNWNMNYKITSLEVLPYTHCRKGKPDDEKYSGKIVVYENFTGENGKYKKDDYKIVDVFNPRKEVIDAQVSHCKGTTLAEKWHNYKGQILYVNLDEQYDYALSTIDEVYYDCDSESQASIYKNRSLRKGFFGKTMVITKPLAGSLEDYDGDTPELRAKAWSKAQSEREAFRETIQDFLGVQNTGGVMHVEMEHDGENFDEVISVKTIGSDINDSLFEYTESSVYKNILLAFNNMPTGLIRSDNSLFANSGDSLRVMKETYQQNTEHERELVEQTITMLMQLFDGFTGETKIIPLIQVDETAQVKANKEQVDNKKIEPKQ